MLNSVVLLSPNRKSQVVINNGELVSYQKFDIEFIHPKEDLGWDHSDTEMFPIVGSTQANNFKVSTPKGECIQDQHGLLRNLDYTLLKNDRINATFKKHYLKNTKINNPKYPSKSTKKEVFWSYDFNFTKKFTLSNDSLKIQFKIESEKGMPFMFGYHPAFNIKGKNIAYCSVNNQKITIADILKAGSNAFPILHQNKLSLFNGNYGLELTTEGFNNFMLWTEVENMICIEPITQYTIKTQDYSEKNMRVSNGKEKFTVLLKPFKI